MIKSFGPEISEKSPASPAKLPSSSSYNQQQRNKLTAFIIGGIIVFLLVLIGIFAVGLYAYNWNDQITNKVISVVPYPAVKIDSKFVSYKAYRDDIETLRYFYDSQGETAGVVPTDSEIDELVLNRLVREWLTAEEAKAKSVSVNDEAVDENFSGLVEQAGSEEEVAKTLTDFYNWDVTTFKKKVIVPYLYREGLQIKLLADEKNIEDLTSTAQSIIDQLADGADFAELAGQYSADVSTASNGGDLGYFGRGVMVSAFEEAAFALEIGQVSGIVKTDFGYHILKLEDKREVDVGEDGTKAEEIHVRHILLTVNVDDWLNEQLKTKSISVYVPGFTWDAEQASIIADNTESE
ncbi:MAG: peptidylprolyl isomerase [Patescibacteria group bacterium]